MKKVLFLDLEDTLIISWDKRVLCSNWIAIREWIKFQNFTEVRIFSYAIWNDEDLIIFNNEMKSWLEEWFNINITTVYTIDFIRRICADQLKIVMDKDDFFSFMKKDISFRLVCETLPDNYDYVLLDDTVKNTSYFIDQKHIYTINVKKIN